jgi:WSC domain
VSTTSSSSGGSSSGSGSSSTPSTVNLPSGWSYGGCYVDNAHGRILSAQQPDSDTVTIESCISTCFGLGYSIVGLEYSRQCFCGTSIINGGVKASSDSDCAMKCSGQSEEICGGPDRMSIYSAGTPQVAAAPKPQTSNLPSTWTYKGCISDQAGQRTLPHGVNGGPTNSATTCLNQCAAQGYTIGGMEYAGECFCGSASELAASGATTSTNCNMGCSGDSAHICGGPGALTYYSL